MNQLNTATANPVVQNFFSGLSLAVTAARTSGDQAVAWIS